MCADAGHIDLNIICNVWGSDGGRCHHVLIYQLRWEGQGNFGIGFVCRFRAHFSQSAWGKGDLSRLDTGLAHPAETELAFIGVSALALEAELDNDTSVDVAPAPTLT